MNEFDSLFWHNKRVYVSGGYGFLGSHLVDALNDLGVCGNIGHRFECDLRDSFQVKRFFDDIYPEVIIHCAGNVGGIGANQQHPAEFFYDNLLMGLNVIHQSYLHKVEKVVVISTACAYPENTPVPFKEEDLWNGFPEPTNSAYGIAKRSLLTMAQAYRQQYGLNTITLLPANLFGVRDSFDDSKSHVIPALIKKCIAARDNDIPTVEIWGDGTPTREFLYVEDAVRGILLATEHYNEPEPINLGTSKEISIAELVLLIVQLTHYQGEVHYNISKPNGQPRRKLDVTKAQEKFGFEAQVSLEEGLRKTIAWYEKERVK